MTVIATSRLTLRKWVWNPLNLKDMVRWLNDSEVVRYSEQRHRLHTEETQTEYLEDGPDIFREIYADDWFIGTIAAYLDRDNSVANVGILIGEKKAWGKGYGIEAWEGFCDALFKFGIRKIEAGCMAQNKPMIRVCQKYQMFPEGVRFNHFKIDDTTSDDLMQFGKFR